VGYACGFVEEGDYAAGWAAVLVKGRYATDRRLAGVMPEAAVCVCAENGWCGSAGAVLWFESWVKVAICY
jgi:hypothetical protein